MAHLFAIIRYALLETFFCIPTLEGVIDKLCSLYRICNISDLLGRNEHQDTIIHFYEEFLTFYDPALRKSLGVFYTPVQAVKYLVAMVDHSLVDDFDIAGGLSNKQKCLEQALSLRVGIISVR